MDTDFALYPGDAGGLPQVNPVESGRDSAATAITVPAMLKSATSVWITSTPFPLHAAIEAVPV